MSLHPVWVFQGATCSWSPSRHCLCWGSSQVSWRLSVYLCRFLFPTVPFWAWSMACFFLLCASPPCTYKSRDHWSRESVPHLSRSFTCIVNLTSLPSVPVLRPVARSRVARVSFCLKDSHRIYSQPQMPLRHPHSQPLASPHLVDSHHLQILGWTQSALRADPLQPCPSPAWVTSTSHGSHLGLFFRG